MTKMAGKTLKGIVPAKKRIKEEMRLGAGLFLSELRRFSYLFLCLL